jgi:hypothetical protein
MQAKKNPQPPRQQNSFFVRPATIVLVCSQFFNFPTNEFSNRKKKYSRTIE